MGDLICLVLIFILGGYMVATDTDWATSAGGFPIPSEAGWVFLFSAAGALFFAIRARLCGGDKPKKYTEEDAATAEAELDALYLREHGEPPEKLWKEQPMAGQPVTDAAPDENKTDKP